MREAACAGKRPRSDEEVPRNRRASRRTSARPGGEITDARDLTGRNGSAAARDEPRVIATFRCASFAALERKENRCRGAGRRRRGRGGGGDFGGGGPGGRLSAGQRPVTEGTRIHIDQQLERFKYGDEEEIVFPPDMNNHDRAVVHACCKKLGLKSKSYGKGDQRRVHVTKPKEFKPQDHEVRARASGGFPIASPP